MQTTIHKTIPPEILERVIKRLPNLPFKVRGISINKVLVQTALEILNYAQENTLPQNCRNDLLERTPDGLDRRIKERIGSNLRTANIVSDELKKAGIVDVIKIKNTNSARMVKATCLLKDWQW